MINRLRHGCLAFGMAVGCIGAAHTVGAEEEVRWDMSPHVAISQIYTDNIGLSPPGQEDHEYITQTDVGFTLNREGRRAELNLAYNLQDLIYWRKTRSNTTYYQFSGDGNVELLPERFFVEAKSTYSQRFRSRRDNVLLDNVNNNGQRSDVLTSHVSPHFIQRLGNFATGQLRYTYDRVDYQGPNTSGLDSETNRAMARIDSGTMFSRIGWELSFQRSETDYDDGSAVTLQTAEALLRWYVTNQFSVFAAGGDEDNEYVQDPRRARPDDTFWRAGASWQPGTRTSMEAYYGERFFGETYGGSLNHRFRHSQLAMEYSEGLATVSSFEIERLVLPVVDGAGDPLIVDGEPVFLVLEFPDLQTGVYLRRRFSLGFSGEKRRLTWSLRGFNERREFEATDRQERVRGVGVNFALRVAPRTQLLLNGSVQDSTYQEDDREDRYYVIGTGMLRDIGPSTSGSIEYRHVERESNHPGFDFRENRVSVRFRKRF